MYCEHGEYRLQSASTTQQVAGHGFGGVDDDLLRMIAQRTQADEPASDLPWGDPARIDPR